MSTVDAHYTAVSTGRDRDGLLYFDWKLLELIMVDEQYAELQRFHRDTEYLESHWDELLETYPEQWVAIFNREVVAVAPDFDQLLADLKRKDVPIGKARIEHLTSEEDLLILPS